MIGLLSIMWPWFYSLKSQSTAGLSVPSFSEMRRWSKWEAMRQARDTFGDVEGFLHTCPGDLAPAMVAKMRGILEEDLGKKVSLKLELVITIDAGEQFVK